MRDWRTKKRPWAVTIVLWGVFFFGVWHLGQAIAIGRQLRLFLQLEFGLDPRWRLLTAVFWAALAGWVGVALWRKRPFVRHAIPLLLASNALYQLAILAWFAPALSPARLSWLAAGFIPATLFSLWALHSQPAQQYLTEGDKRLDRSTNRYPLIRDIHEPKN